MSVRIHQLSKQIGIENKELIALLQERGYATVKSASSTIDNISAESLVEEFQAKQEEAEPAESQPESPAEAETPEEAPAAPRPESEASIKLPPGVFVKSAD